MILSDQHIHSDRSSDCAVPMPDMARASFARGVRHICFTDHIDLDESETGAPFPAAADAWPRTVATYRAACETAPAGMTLRLGMELGEAHHHPAAAEALHRAPEADLILGSLHNLRGTPDFYCLRYESEAQCELLNRLYVAELMELAELDCFDIMAHIGYTARYMGRAGFKAAVTIEEHGDALRQIFVRLIERGKGIELNCSGLRYGGGTFPTLPILRLYRDLGGELITVGSDAHTAAAASEGVREGHDILRENGFRYVALYSGRKPTLETL